MNNTISGALHMRKKALIYIVLSGIFWGTSAIFANLLSPFGFSSPQMTAMRGVVAAVVMAIYVLIKDKSMFKVTPGQLFLFACGGLATFLSAIFYYESIKRASVSVAVMLMYTAPIFVMSYSVAFLGEKFTVKKAISVVCVLVGCILISGVLGGANFNFWGVVTGLLAGISYSTYNIIAKIQMDKRCNPLSATVYGFIFMAVFAVLCADMGNLFELASVKPSVTYPLIIGIGIFTVALPYFLYTSSLKHIPVGTAATLGMIEPMTATIFGVTLFNDPLTPVSFCGIILILFAVFILAKDKN